MKTFALLLLFAFASVVTAKEPPRYRFRPLGSLSATGHSHPNQINNRGVVIGTALTNGVGHAVLWNNGTILDLGLLPGADHGSGTAINDLNQFIADAPGSYFQPGLVPTPPGYSMLGGEGLNSAGQVAGNIRNLNSGGSLPFIYQNGNLIVLPPLIPGGYAHAVAINKSGQVLGAAQKTQSDAVPVIYQGTNIIHELTDALIAASFRISSQGAALNDQGQVVGSGEVTLRPRRSAPYETVHGFLYRNGSVTDLLPLRGYNYSLAWDLNESGDIVGTSFNTETENSTPMLWRDKKKHDLARRIKGGTQGWKLLTATGINNQGFIIGSAEKNGERQAFLLEPLGQQH